MMDNEWFGLRFEIWDLRFEIWDLRFVNVDVDVDVDVDGCSYPIIIVEHRLKNGWGDEGGRDIFDGEIG